MRRLVLAASLLLATVPFAGPASARCPEDAVLCHVAGVTCAVLREVDPDQGCWV